MWMILPILDVATAATNLMMIQNIPSEIWKKFRKEKEKLEEYNDFQVESEKLTPETNKAVEKFFELFLNPNEKFPPGARHLVIEKNFAIWLVQNNIDLQPIKESYRKIKRDFKSLYDQIQGVKSGTYKNPHVSVGELVNWCKEYRPDLVKLFQNQRNLNDPTVTITHPKDKEETRPITYEPLIIPECELKNYKENYDWLIDNLIPLNSLGFHGGKSGSLKSYLEQYFAICISAGLPIFDKLAVKKGTVLYLDRENGIPIIRDRVNLLKRGLGIPNKKLDIYFAPYPDLKLDNKKGIAWLNSILGKHKPIFVIVDTWRAFIRFDDNKSEFVRPFVEDTIKPIIRSHGASLCFIDHHSKGRDKKDYMESLYGAGDKAAVADFVIHNKALNKNRIIFSQSKNRGAKELDDVEVEFNFDEAHTSLTSIFDYKPMTKSRIVSQRVLKWITEEKITTFQTKNANDLFKDEEKITRQMVDEALHVLVGDGIITKSTDTRGRYEVNQQTNLA